MKHLYLLLLLVVLPGAAFAQTATVVKGTTSLNIPLPVRVDASGQLVLSPTSSTVGATCNQTTSVQAVTSVGVAAVSTPASAAAGRKWVLLCNSAENAGTPKVKCLVNGTAPVMGVANPGEVMQIGDCIVYPVDNASAIKCISDVAATAVTSFECVPNT